MMGLTGLDGSQALVFVAILVVTNIAFQCQGYKVK